MVCKDLKSVVETNLSSPIQSWLTSIGTGKTRSPSRQNRQEKLKSVATKSLDKITLWFLICCCLCFCTDYDTPQQRLCGQQQQSSLRAAAQCQKKSSLRSHLVSVSKKTSSPQALQQPTFQNPRKHLTAYFESRISCTLKLQNELLQDHTWAQVLLSSAGAVSLELRADFRAD